MSVALGSASTPTTAQQPTGKAQGTADAHIASNLVFAENTRYCSFSH